MIIYTDGACIPNPGTGGWGFIIKDTNITNHGGDFNTTNNRMELFAIIKAIEYYINNIDNEGLTIYSDSMLCVNTGNTWIYNWEKKGIIEKKKNTDLIFQLLNLLKQVKVKFIWVKAHNGDYYNEKADLLSNIFIEKNDSRFSYYKNNKYYK